MRKGQISIFIILGIAFLLGFSFIIIVFQQSQVSSEILNPDYSLNTKDIALSTSIDTCIKDNAELFLSELALRGGYISQDEGNNKVSVLYYLTNGTDTIPEMSDVEIYFEILLEELFKECVNSAFSRTNEIIYELETNPKVLINEDTVFISPNYYISYELDGTIYEKESAFMTLNHPFGNMYLAAKDITKRISENSGFVDYTYLSRLDYDVYMDTIDANTIFFSLKKIMNTNEYVYSFLVEVSI